MNLHADSSLGFEEDDDVFYAELRRQILLLTADDNEDFAKPRIQKSRNVIKQGSNTSTASFPAHYFNWWEKENCGSTPAWLSHLWRNSNGTGVFIPHIVKSRRKPKPGMRLLPPLVDNGSQNVLNSISFILHRLFKLMIVHISMLVCRKDEQ
ncbi:hypothetical protein L1049_006941 [Liquidambar formosana]|uniref:Uncharacterized protein n=1 Tax=Liquidambar formosana TaxID=63359 RepID=A0AAP0RHY7_LIQFO